MDQCRDRCWAFHRIGQPGVQAKLGGFAHRANEQQNTSHLKGGKRVTKERDIGFGQQTGIVEDDIKFDGSKNLVDGKNAKGKRDLV